MIDQDYMDADNCRIDQEYIDLDIDQWYKFKQVKNKTVYLQHLIFMRLRKTEEKIVFLQTNIIAF